MNMISVTANLPDLSDTVPLPPRVLYLLSLSHPIAARSFTSLGTLGDSTVDMHGYNP